MKITFRTPFLVVAFNILLGMALVFFLSRGDNLGMMVYVTLVVIALSVCLLIPSLLIVAIVQKPWLEPKIYSFGQLAGTIIIIGYPAFMTGYNYNSARSNYVNIEHNRSFVGRDSVAFRQLEAQFANKNDLRLHSVFTYQQDTTKDSIILFFIYNTPDSRKEYLTSKHVMDSSGTKMIYYDFPYAENTELQEMEHYPAIHPPN